MALLKKSLFIFKLLVFTGILAYATQPLKAQAQGLSCDKVYQIQNQFFFHHVLYSSPSKKLQETVVDQMIENLDPEKIYFLKSDVNNIKKRFKNIFRKLSNGNCTDLYYIYNLYNKRFKNRSAHINKYLNNNFKMDRKSKYIIDSKKKDYPVSERQANQDIKSYVQYQIANIFITEKDVKKSIKLFSHILKNREKQIKSWKPRLTREEVKTCIQKSKNSFASCKPNKWYAFYLNAFAESLDIHSSYLDPDAVEAFQISMNLSLEGIGATLRSRFGYTVVERLVPGGAAFKSKKIQKKDKIIAVGKNPSQMINIFGESLDDVVSLIRGKAGTPVYLKILRDSDKKTKKEFVVKLIRSKINLKEEAASLEIIHKKSLNKNYKIAVIKTPSFYGSASYGKSLARDVRRLIYKAKKAQAHAIVLDLSNNRGGSLDESVDVAGLFFGTGNVTKHFEKNKNFFKKISQASTNLSSINASLNDSLAKDKDPSIDYAGPLVVLVNKYSASASEIVAGALQDYKRAVIVGGNRTYGKGSVQSVVSAGPALGAIKTTVGLYFIPSGRSPQKIGITPDISLPNILNLDKLGESNFDNALPSQTVASFKSPPREIFSPKKTWKPIDKSTIKTLTTLSQQRVKKSDKFKKIQTHLSKYKKRMDNKFITVGEILDEKNEMDLELEATEEENLDDENYLNPKIRRKRYLKRADIQEAAQIAADLARLQK